MKHPIHHVIRHSAHIASHPGKLVRHGLHRYAEKRYGGKTLEEARRLLKIDIGLLIVGLSLITTGIYLLLRPPAITKLVEMNATVAPTDVVSGGSSTLVIRYENRSTETLNHARLQLAYPAHFVLQDAPTEFPAIDPQTFDLGNIEPGASGSIKLRGVMFGDVGGDQTFTSTLDFVYGKQNKPANKTSTHTFHPVRSTLELKLLLPERLVAGQEVDGSITYKNTGEVDFPEILLEPVWADDFALLSSDPGLTDGALRLKALTAGEEGIIHFRGRLPQGSSGVFTFHPSFTFGEDRYRQDTLTETVELLPPQLLITQSTEATSFTPGGSITLVIDYKHTGTYPVDDVVLRVAADSAIFKTTGTTGVTYKDGYYVIDKTTAPTLAKVAPGESGQFSITIPLNNSLSASQTNIYKNLQPTLAGSALYTLTDGVDARITVATQKTTLPLTSPVYLQSFGRYTSPQGDQIGRGPLPPLVRAETKYWIFLTVTGTTNDLSNVKLDADLGPGVRFTGKQSVSVGESLQYDQASNSMIWNIGSLEPTLAPQSRVMSVAFEVSITPSAEMIGTTPVLISSPLLTAQDAFTGAFVTSRGLTVTTNLPYDQMAKGLGKVEE